MNYANILTVLTGANDDAVTLLAAAKMAQAAQGAVSVVVAPPLMVLNDWAETRKGFGPSISVRDACRRAQLKLRRDVEALAREITDRLGLELEETSGRIILVEEQVASALDLSDLTPFTDLVVIGQRTLQDLGPWSGLIATALLQAQLPVLAISALPEELPATVAVAWNGGQRAARAVRAALPYLVAADHVVILQDPDHLTLRDRQTARPERLVDYLRRHGVRAVSIRCESGISRDGGLAQLARETGTGLLVAGAFDHSRLVEDILGGVTLGLIAKSRGFNLLFAH